MSQKRAMGEMDERMERVEEALDTLKSRLSAIEERLFQLEMRAKSAGKDRDGEEGGDGETLDLSQYPTR